MEENQIFKRIQKENRRYYYSPHLEARGVSNRLTLRPLDYGIKTNPDKMALKALYRQGVLDLVGAEMDEDYIFFPQQVHGGGVSVVAPHTKGQPCILGQYIQGVDGLVTGHKEICLISQYADCTPIVLWDRPNQVLAVVHAGWRGTLSRIATNAIKLMVSEFGTAPANLMGYIFPHIGQRFFEVDEDVAQAFLKEFESDFASFGLKKEDILEKKGLKYHIDTGAINKMLLLLEGMASSCVFRSKADTFSEVDFHSYRRDKEDSGRMALILKMDASLPQRGIKSEI